MANSEKIDKIIEKAVNAGIKAASNLNPFKRTEQLLYSYPTLKQQIIKTEQYIEDLNKVDSIGKSKDIATFGGGGSGESKDMMEVHQERIQEKLKSLERTRTDVKWIEVALDAVCNEKHFEIIEMRYFGNMSIVDIADILGMNQDGVNTHKRHLVKRLSVFLFGSDAVNM